MEKTRQRIEYDQIRREMECYPDPAIRAFGLLDEQAKQSYRKLQRRADFLRKRLLPLWEANRW